MKSNIYKSIIILLTVGSSLYFFESCSSNSNRSSAQNEKEEVIDSAEIILAQQQEEALKAQQEAEQKEREKIIKEVSSNFIEKKDEFSNKTWIEPKNSPKYRNRDATFCYFMKEGNCVSNFRFVLQYEDDDWLFIQSLVINVDGKNHDYPNLHFETDCGNGGRIWEWCDLQMEDVSLIDDLENAKSVKIKMNGRQYYDTRTLSSKDLISIQKTIKYYKALGGKFG